MASQAVRAKLENRSFNFRQTAISTVGNLIANDFIEGQVDKYTRRNALQNAVGGAFNGAASLNDDGRVTNSGGRISRSESEPDYADIDGTERFTLTPKEKAILEQRRTVKAAKARRSAVIAQKGESSSLVNGSGSVGGRDLIVKNGKIYDRVTGKEVKGRRTQFAGPVTGELTEPPAWGSIKVSSSTGALPNPTQLLPADLFQQMKTILDSARSGLGLKAGAKKLLKRGVWAILPSFMGGAPNVTTFVDAKNKNREYIYTDGGDDSRTSIKVTDYLIVNGQRLKAASWTFDLRYGGNEIDYDGVQVAEIVNGEIIALGNLNALRPTKLYLDGGTWNPKPTTETKTDAKGRELQKGEIILAGGIAVTGWSSRNRRTSKQGSYTIYFRDEDGYVVKYHGRGNFARMARSAALRSRIFNSKVINFNWTANDGGTIAQNRKNSKKDEAARIWHHDAGPQLNLNKVRTANLESNAVNVNIYGGTVPTGRNYNAVFTGVKYLYAAYEAIRNPASIQGWPLSVSRPSPDGHPSYNPRSKIQRDRMAELLKTY